MAHTFNHSTGTLMQEDCYLFQDSLSYTVLKPYLRNKPKWWEWTKLRARSDVVRQGTNYRDTLCTSHMNSLIITFDRSSIKYLRRIAQKYTSHTGKMFYSIQIRGWKKNKEIFCVVFCSVLKQSLMYPRVALYVAKEDLKLLMSCKNHSVRRLTIKCIICSPYGALFGLSNSVFSFHL